MALVLYEASSGEIRARVFDEAETPITDATLVCTLYNARQRPAIVFSARAMTYSAGHPFTDTTDLGCYFCTVSALELTGTSGLWQAVITATDSSAHVLTTIAFIEVTPFVVG